VSELHIDTENDGDRGFVRLSGEADLPSIPFLESVVRPLLECGRSVVVDIANLEFCSYSVISALDRLRVATASSGGDLYVAGATQRLRGLLRKIGMTAILIPEAERSTSQSASGRTRVGDE
jgi:anti-anti-sigma factor